LGEIKHVIINSTGFIAKLHLSSNIWGSFLCKQKECSRGAVVQYGEQMEVLVHFLEDPRQFVSST